MIKMVFQRNDKLSSTQIEHGLVYVLLMSESGWGEHINSMRNVDVALNVYWMEWSISLVNWVRLVVVY